LFPALTRNAGKPAKKLKKSLPGKGGEETREAPKIWPMFKKQRTLDLERPGAKKQSNKPYHQAIKKIIKLSVLVKVFTRFLP
jgi:hypothetical protein